MTDNGLGKIPEGKFENIDPEKRIQETPSKQRTIQQLPSNPTSLKYKLKFTHSPMMNEMHKREIEEDGEIKRVLRDNKYNLTNLFFRDLQWRMKNEKNVIIVIYGKTGTGKSSMAQRIAMELHRYLPRQIRRNAKLDVSNIAFTRDQLLGRLENSEEGETVIYDEDREESYGMGSQREREQMKRIEQSVRAESINFIFCSPRPRDHEQHYTIRAFDVEYHRKINRGIIYFTQEKYWRRPVGTLYLRKCFYDGYMKKKKKFVKNIKKSRTSGREIRYIKVAKNMYDSYEAFPYRSNDQNKMLMKIEYGGTKFTEEELGHIINIARLWKKGDITPEEILRRAQENAGVQSIVDSDGEVNVRQRKRGNK